MIARSLALRTWFALLALALVATSCGGSDVADDGATTVGSTTSESAESTTAGTEPMADHEDPATITGTVRSIALPEGMEVFVGSGQRTMFHGTTYMASPRADGVRLIAIDGDGARDTSAVIAGAVTAAVHHSGTRLVMTGSDGDGSLVVLASTDGSSFEETRIAIPDRYVAMDEWAGTEARASVAGVADLNGELYVIAWTGTIWQRPDEVVARYGYTISQEVGDAATSAGTIRSKPLDDGDRLYTFVKDDEVVLEVLASEAGLEPGYQEAYDAFVRQESPDFGTTSGWILAGGVASETTNPPLDGGLDANLRLNQLFSVGNGVAAVVTDFAPGEAAAPRGLAFGGDSYAGGWSARLSTSVSYGIHHTWDGESWEVGTENVGDPDLPTPRIFLDSDYGRIGMIQTGQDKVVLHTSDDGIAWDAVDRWATNLELAGNRVETIFLDGALIQIVHPTREGGEYRAYKVTLDGEGGDALLEEIDLETGEVLEWSGSVLDELGAANGAPPSTPSADAVVVETFDVDSDPLSAIFFGNGLQASLD